MPSEKMEGSVAILLDFENAKDADLHRVLAEGARFGRVTVRRAYADWSRFAGVAGALREAGFEEVHSATTGSRGKNATDIHLTVDAMDLLYMRPVDTFVLVTADSDFAKLARRIREGGKRVLGVGARGRVGRALVQSCDEYVYYDVAEGAPSTPAAPAAPKIVEPAKAPAAKAAPGAKPEADVTTLHRVVLEAMEAAADDSGRVYGGPLHESIRRIHPDFSYRDFGYSSFLKAIESLAPVVRAKHANDVSDFVVWVDPQFEDVARHVVQSGGQDASRPVLDEDVQRHIDQTWRGMLGGRKRLQGRKAAEAVSLEYGVTKLSETPLGDLDGVLAAAPTLTAKWKREGGFLQLKD